MRKNSKFILAAAMMSILLAGCSGNQEGTTVSSETAAESVSSAEQTAAQPETENAETENTTTEENTETVQDSGNASTGGDILVAYFSVPETDGVDTVAGASPVAVDGEVLGNTQYTAQLISQETGGDLFRIETVQEYPGTHDALLEFAYEELSEDARPELSTQIENLDSYDTIFLGYPNWNAELPMPLYTFLEEYDLSGKTIIPFVTHGGSGFSRTIQTIQQMQPEAQVMEQGLSISRNSAADAAEGVSQWIEELGLGVQ